MADGIKNNIFLVNAPAGSGKTTTIEEWWKDIYEKIQMIIFYV